MKTCELCKSRARTYCESDQASLCWSCDAKVHGANFLVARHLRTLLCPSCQSLTPWQAAGAKLAHTVSFCRICANEDEEEQEQDGGSEDRDSEDEQQEGEEDGGDNQVVPWSATTPPPASSSLTSSSSASSGGEFVESRNVVSLKRTRESSTDLRYLLQDNINFSSSHRKYGQTPLTTRSRSGGEGEATSINYSFKPLKNRKTETGLLQTSSRSAAIVESLMRLDPSNNVKVSEESEAVDDEDEVVSSDNSSRTI